MRFDLLGHSNYPAFRKEIMRLIPTIRHTWEGKYTQEDVLLWVGSYIGQNPRLLDNTPPAEVAATVIQAYQDAHATVPAGAGEPAGHTTT